MAAQPVGDGDETIEGLGVHTAFVAVDCESNVLTINKTQIIFGNCEGTCDSHDHDEASSLLFTSRELFAKGLDGGESG
jgi:hypothetical protein